MTDNQLYLAIGIPGSLFALNFLAILAAAFWQSKRFEDMGKRFDDMGKRVDDMGGHLNSRIDSLENVMNAKFAAVDAKFEAQTQGLYRVEQVIDARLKHLEER